VHVFGEAPKSEVKCAVSRGSVLEVRESYYGPVWRQHVFGTGYPINRDNIKLKQDLFGRSKGDVSWHQTNIKNWLLLIYIVIIYIYIINMNCVKCDNLIPCKTKIIWDRNNNNNDLYVRRKGGGNEGSGVWGENTRKVSKRTCQLTSQDWKNIETCPTYHLPPTPQLK
jgi:hypothetical protein